MQIGKIKKYLKHYKILSRWTTFNGAIQHALAVPDAYDETKIKQLLKILGQKEDEDLNCIYCDESAATWDHLYNNVQKSKFSGYGNRIFNLVPACRTCNEKKGSKHWKEFIKNKKNKDEITKKLLKIEKLNKAQLKPWEHIKKTCPDLANQYEALTTQVKNNLKELDEIAAKIRDKMK